MKVKLLEWLIATKSGLKLPIQVVNTDSFLYAVAETPFGTYQITRHFEGSSNGEWILEFVLSCAYRRIPTPRQSLFEEVQKCAQYDFDGKILSCIEFDSDDD